MILILTTQAGDYSHIKIIDWLSYLKANFLIITGEGLMNGMKKLTITKGEIFYNDINLSKEVTCVFYRRWITGSEIRIIDDEELNTNLNRNLVAEMLEIRTFLWNNLKNAIWIPEVGPVSVNKLSNLDLAKSIGFNVPDYMVTNSKDDLNRFFLKNEGKIITKAIGNFQNAQTMDGFLVNSIYTKQVDTTLIKLLPEKFALSFFQKLIEKKHEYRILYFNK